MTRRKSFSPASLVMTGASNQTTFEVGTKGGCGWQVYIGTGVDSVTTPLGTTYPATMIELDETIIGSGPYSIDHIQHLGNVGTMEIDSVVVN